jgi:serine/threonine-protein kinase
MATPAIIGRYEVIDRLGEGGMGAVYLARDPSIGRQVAIKVLHGHLADASLRQRFVQEARSAGSLTHPNIVTIHDFGEVDGAPFIVMEYVRGANLAAVIRRRDDIRLADKLEWLEGLCAGLHYAHQARIIHRDVKPQNLMVTEYGAVKILDFGIARVAESGLTKVSMVIGTPGYMSPEQIEGHAVDRRSDIFSAGAVAYALISYREAFAGDTVATVMHRVLTSYPPSLSSICSGLPPAIATIVDRALEKDPADRFQDVSEMRQALAAARAALPPGFQEPRVAPPISTDEERRTPAARTPANLRKRRAEQLQRLVQDARNALARGDRAAAAEAADAALLIDPDHLEAQRLLAQAHEPQTVETEVISTAALVSPPPSIPSRSTPEPAPIPATPRPRPAPPKPPTMQAQESVSTRAAPERSRAPMLVAAAAAAVVAAGGLWMLAKTAMTDTPSSVSPPVEAAPVQPPVPAPRSAESGASGQTSGASAQTSPPRDQSESAPQPSAAVPKRETVATSKDAEPSSSRKPVEPQDKPPPTAAPSAEDRVRAEGLVRRANAKYEAGDYDGAIDDLNSALESVPGHERAAALLKSVLRARETEAKMRRRPPQV